MPPIVEPRSFHMIAPYTASTTSSILKMWCSIPMRKPTSSASMSSASIRIQKPARGNAAVMAAAAGAVGGGVAGAGVAGAGVAGAPAGACGARASRTRAWPITV